MKESVTKFDLEAAFKALDEIDIPVSNEGVKANRPALTEIFSRKSKFDSLFEEYYDIGSSEELGQAKEDREAEVAKAKLERIEKIVDLDADSPEDLLTSYVGKYIIQCPQCMTLFYKNQEDVVESEDDPNTVNVSEVCQHCGNESGYTLVGKVGEATAEDTSSEFDLGEMSADEELPTEELPDDGAEETTEEPAEGEEDLGDFDLDALNLDDEAVEEEEKKEEAFMIHTGETLVEDVQDDKDLDAKLEAHNEYIEYLRAEIAKEEKELEKTKNEQVKAAIQRRIDAYKEDLEKALPDEVKNNMTVEEPVEEPTEESVEELTDGEETEATLGEALTEALKEGKEAADLDVSADEFEKLINEPEFKKPISDSTVRAMIAADKEAEEKEDSDVKEAKAIDHSEPLEEAGIRDLGKAIGKKLGQAGKNIKNKLSAVVDKFIDKLNTREEKADWILANACIDPDKVEIPVDGKTKVEDDNRKFKCFVIVGFTDKYKNGKPVNVAPSPKSMSDLTIGTKQAQVKYHYENADSLAKGWSMRQGCGPAFIYLANSADDKNAVFLCEYFKGNLEYDQLDKHFEEVKNEIKSAVLVAKSGGIQDDSTEEGEPSDDKAGYKEISASELKPGMKFELNGEKVELVAIGDLKASDGSTAREGIMEVKEADGNSGLYRAPAPTEKVKVYNENLNTIMNQLEELQEASLESFIASSLVESYGNVAGFKLTDSEYLDESLKVNGTVYFTSGASRKLTYAFYEAYNENGKIKLCGLNEKLGLDKRFILTGKIDDTNKTFITESFTRNK